MANILYKGYFGLHIQVESVWVQFIIYSTHCIAFLIQCVISFLACMKMKKRTDIHWSLNVSFAVSVASALLITIASIGLYKTYDDHDRDDNNNTVTVAIVYISALSSALFFLSLLVTYILRLYIMFKSSAYRMSNQLILMFLMILTLSMMGFFATSALFVSHRHEMKVNHWMCTCSLWVYISFFIAIVWYTIGCVLTVYYFVTNLSKLAADRLTTPSDRNSNEIELDQYQQGLSNLSAKYTMLFGFAIGSTILSYLLTFTVNVNSGLRPCFQVIDLCINLWCLMLQYSWSASHYRRWCGCCDKKSRYFMEQRTLRLVSDQSVSKLTNEHCSHETVDEDEEEEKN